MYVSFTLKIMHPSGLCRTPHPGGISWRSCFCSTPSAAVPPHRPRPPPDRTGGSWGRRFQRQGKSRPQGAAAFPTKGKRERRCLRCRIQFSMCHYLDGGLHGRKKRVKAQSESSKSVVNSVLISREMPVFPGFLEIIRVVIVKILIGVQYERVLQPCLPSPSSLRSATYPRGRGKV